MKTAFLYSDTLTGFDYGSDHPLKTFRLRLAYELIQAYGLLSMPETVLIEPRLATEDELLLFHRQDYLAILRSVNTGKTNPMASQYGLGAGDNPVFKGLFDWSRLVAGASVQAAEMVESGQAEIVFSISGGLHHALPSRASGFCYINDPVIAIQSLVRKGRRVAYVDIDAHHGDGVQAAFYDTDAVLTISVHETGAMLFPGSGFEYETGTGTGKGYSVNLPMPSYADDELFLFAFDEIVTPLLGAFSPDIIVTQLGVDSFYGDPLAHLAYTTHGFCEALKKLRTFAPGWVALGGGGYDIANVARAWTLAWAIMNDKEIPDNIPDAYMKIYGKYGFQNGRVRDDRVARTERKSSELRTEVERVVAYIRAEVFPVFGL